MSKQQTQTISSSIDVVNSHINRITKKGDYQNHFNKPKKCIHCNFQPTVEMTVQQNKHTAEFVRGEVLY